MKLLTTPVLISVLLAGTSIAAPSGISAPNGGPSWQLSQREWMVISWQK